MNVADESMPIGVVTPRRQADITRKASRPMSAADLVGERPPCFSGSRLWQERWHRLVRPIAILMVGLPIVLAISDIVNAVSCWPYSIGKRPFSCQEGA